MSTRARPLRIAALLAVALWAIPAGAQEAAAPAAEPPPAEPPKPQVIAIGEVAAKASALEKRLQEIEADLTEAAAEAGAKQDLEEATAAIEKARADIDAAIERATLTSDLNSLATRWEGYGQQLLDIENALAVRVTQLEDLLAAIKEDAELWKRTAAAGGDASAPQAVRSRIAEIERSIQRTGAALTKQRNAVLELQAQATSHHESIQPLKARIADTAHALNMGLLVRQDDPLWRSWPGGDQFEKDRGTVRDRIVGLSVEAQDYARRKSSLFVVDALVILILAWLFLRARQAVETQRAASGVDPGGALRHPAAAAVLGWFCLIGLIHPEIVRGLRFMAAAITLPFWYRVLSGMLPPALHGVLRGAALLALVEILRTGAGDSFLGRTILLGEVVAGAAGVWWLRRPARLAVIPPRLLESRWMRVLDAWLRVLLVLFSAAAVCTILGYTSLAGRLSLLAITSSFFGAGFIALVRILELLSEWLLSASLVGSIRMIRGRRGATTRAISRVLRAGAGLLWLHLALDRAQLWDPLTRTAEAALSKPLGFGTGHFTLGGILAFVLTLWFSWMLARFVSSALDEEIFPRVDMPPGVPFALARFARYGVLVMGFVIAMGTLGFSLDRVTLLISALGVGIGFGLQTVVNNFVSGVILLFERPVRVGDRVQLADLLGVVTHIGIRASRIRTFDGSDVIVPNGDLLASQLINWTLSDAKRRIILPVGVAYGTDPEKVLQILGTVAREHAEVLEDPAPDALFLNFGDSSLDFELRAWTASERGWYPVRSDLAVAINRAFQEAGIQIPFPQRDLHLRNLDEVRAILPDPPRREPDS